MHTGYIYHTYIPHLQSPKQVPHRDAQLTHAVRFSNRSGCQQSIVSYHELYMNMCLCHYLSEKQPKTALISKINCMKFTTTQIPNKNFRYVLLRVSKQTFLLFVLMSRTCLLFTGSSPRNIISSVET